MPSRRCGGCLCACARARVYKFTDTRMRACTHTRTRARAYTHTHLRNTFDLLRSLVHSPTRATSPTRRTRGLTWLRPPVPSRTHKTQGLGVGVVVGVGVGVGVGVNVGVGVCTCACTHMSLRAHKYSHWHARLIQAIEIRVDQSIFGGHIRIPTCTHTHTPTTLDARAHASADHVLERVSVVRRGVGGNDPPHPARVRRAAVWDPSSARGPIRTLHRGAGVGPHAVVGGAPPR